MLEMLILYVQLTYFKEMCLNWQNYLSVWSSAGSEFKQCSCGLMQTKYASLQTDIHPNNMAQHYVCLACTLVL